MKHRLLLAGLLVAFLTHLSPKTTAQPADGKKLPPRLERRVKEFFAQKEASARDLARNEKEQAPEVWKFFAAGKGGDWETVDELYRGLRARAYQYDGGNKDPRLERMVWQAVNESYGAYDEVADGEERYVTYFGEEIIASISPGSIYFGGTDPGRWLVTAFCKSHVKADPCFVLTQNALADSLYLRYLNALFGKTINIPSEEDSQRIFQEYIADAKRRLEADQLKPGEIVVEEEEGKVHVSGQVAVMEINARLARLIFDKNPAREFFVEESFPLDWMYPHLVPNGLIMKVERKPPVELSTKLLEQSRVYWNRFVESAVGKVVTPTTSVKELCDYATAVFEKGDRSKFRGDVRFLENKPAQRTFSKLRSSIGGLYSWRARHSTSKLEQQRMVKEAESAFQQAFALCPYSPEAAHRYTDLLVSQGRKADARLLAQTAENINPGDSSLSKLAWELEESSK